MIDFDYLSTKNKSDGSVYRSYHHDIANFFYKNQRNRRCKGTFSNPGTRHKKLLKLEARFFAWGPEMGYWEGLPRRILNFILAARYGAKINNFWTPTPKFTFISASRSKFKICFGSPTQHPILVLYAKTHASSYISFFWRVPGLEKAPLHLLFRWFLNA